jgi:cell division protein FtsL
MDDEVLNAIEHIIVALAAVVGSIVAYKAANRHTNGKVAKLEERLEELEQLERLESLEEQLDKGDDDPIRPV